MNDRCNSKSPCRGRNRLDVSRRFLPARPSYMMKGIAKQLRFEAVDNKDSSEERDHETANIRATPGCGDYFRASRVHAESCSRKRSAVRADQSTSDADQSPVHDCSRRGEVLARDQGFAGRMTAYWSTKARVDALDPDPLSLKWRQCRKRQLDRLVETPHPGQNRFHANARFACQTSIRPDHSPVFN